MGPREIGLKKITDFGSTFQNIKTVNRATLNQN